MKRLLEEKSQAEPFVCARTLDLTLEGAGKKTAIVLIAGRVPLRLDATRVGGQGYLLGDGGTG